MAEPQEQLTKLLNTLVPYVTTLTYVYKLFIYSSRNGRFSTEQLHSTEIKTHIHTVIQIELYCLCTKQSQANKHSMIALPEFGANNA